MALPSPRDPEVARTDLARWLAAQLPGASDLRVSPLSGPPSTGFSNETIVFDATWTEGGAEHEHGFVVRVRPSDHTVFPADRFEDQYRVLAELAPLGLKVPTVRWYEQDESVLDAPFMVMDRVGGTAPKDVPPYTDEGFLFDAAPRDQERLWWSGLDALASIDNVDLGAIDVSFLRPGEHGGGTLAQRLEYWERYLAWAADGREQPVPEAALAWLRDNLPATEGERALCWGDARIGNQLFRDFEVQAILDWEMVHVGDPVWDLAWFVWLDGHFSEGCERPRLPGLPSERATVARWERLTGRTVQDFGWHKVLAGLAFGSIMVRLGGLLEHFEIFPASTGSTWPAAPPTSPPRSR